MNDRMKWKMKRIESGYKANRLADELGIAGATLSYYENGHRGINPDTERRYHSLIINRLEDN